MPSDSVLSRRGLLAALGGGISLGAAALLGTDAVVPRIDLSARQPAGQWPMEKREPQRTGYQAQPGPRTGLTERWQREVGPTNILRPGLVATDGRVYTAGRYTVRAFSGVDGTSDWTRRHRDQFPSLSVDSPFEFIQSGPSVNGERLYTVAGVTLYDTQASTGSSGWAFRTNSSFERLLPVGNVVYAGVLVDGDYRLVALDQSTGLRRWTVVTPEVPLAFASAEDPGTDAALLLSGTGTRPSAGRLVARDPTNGELLWRTAPGNQVFTGLTTPAIARGRVYAGGATLTAFDTADGSITWRIRLPELPSSVSPVTDGEQVYVAGGGVAVGLDAATGDRQWTTAVGETSVYVASVVADSTLYLAERGAVTALNTTDGSERFRHSVSDTDALVSGMVSADGRLFVHVGRSLRAYVGQEGETA